MTETINKGDRVYIDVESILKGGLIGTVTDFEESTKRPGLYEWIKLTDVQHSVGLGMHEFTMRDVWLFQITTIKSHEDTERQQYTGEWGGQQQ